MSIVVPFSNPSSLASSGSAPDPNDPFTLMAAAQMHSEGRLIDPASAPQAQPKTPVKPQQMAANEGTGPPQAIENVLSLHAQGKATPAQVRAAMPQGWSVDLRRGRYDYEVTSPSGAIHYVQP